MVSNEIMHKLFIAFPKGNINRNMEFVADPNPKEVCHTSRKSVWRWQNKPVEKDMELFFDGEG